MTTEQEFLGNEKKCPTPDLHGNPFRYCPNCNWIEEPTPDITGSKISGPGFELTAEGGYIGGVQIHQVDVTKQKPSLGRVVLYQLSGRDARAINARREDAENKRPGAERTGVMVHVGNRVQGGDIFAATIVRVWNDNHVNLQVQLDGNDLYWITSVREGEEMGNYSWPPRA